MRTLIPVLILTPLLLSPVPSLAQGSSTGSAPYCLKDAATGALACSFGTMGACEDARGSVSGSQCMTQSDVGGVTGLADNPNGRVPPPAYQPRTTGEGTRERTPER